MSRERIQEVLRQGRSDGLMDLTNQVGVRKATTYKKEAKQLVATAQSQQARK